MSNPSTRPFGQSGQRLPTGTVTFLFTDIEGSTQLWEKHPEEMKLAIATHDAILREAIEANHGSIIKTTGDGVHAVFSTAIDAINAAIVAQRNFQYPINNIEIKIRMGLHTGEAELRADDYYGQTLNRAARIMSAGHGGQLLISSVTAELAREHLPENSSLHDLGEHRLKNLSKTEHLFQVNTTDLLTEFPALKSLPALQNNIPIQVTSFIGRERELEEAKQKLEAARLLTLIGPGGTGKTRLSIQLAADLLPSFKDGVWFIELAPITEPSLVLQAVAKVFDVREQPGMPISELVFNYLRDKHLLLMLDNCEHLVEACARLADQFLHASSNLKILASSREALGINGETVYRVPSLSLPPDFRSLKDFGSLIQIESIQLFLDRASAVNPKFSLTEKNAASVAQICHRLDGIPLAIELAAARITVFSAEQIAARLDDRFKLLTGGSRTALPRQQTLRALIDWSYDILSEEEQKLFRQLSIFAGGWSFETAEAIFSDLNVLDLLTQLINKSLVVVEESAEARFRLLETVRQYARDKLLESGEGEDVRNKHLAYFLELVEAAEPHLEGFEYLEWSAKLNNEYDNIRAALEWGLTKDIEAALRLVGTISFFWLTKGYSAEGYRWAKEVLEKAKAYTRSNPEIGKKFLNAHAKAYLALSRIATDLGDNKIVCSAANESIALARKTGDMQILAYAIALLSNGKANLGDIEEAYKLAQESLAIAREAGDGPALGYALVTMGELTAIAMQDLEKALAYGEEAIAYSEAGGNRWGSSMTIFGLGYFARSIGNYEQARSRFKACLPVFQEFGDKHRINMIQSELAHIEREQGQFGQALPMYRETILEWQRLGHRAALAHQLECFAFIAKAQEQPERAARLFGTAEALREKISIAMTPQERIQYEREINDLRANMDEKSFLSLWAEGRGLNVERAVDFALEEHDG